MTPLLLALYLTVASFQSPPVEPEVTIAVDPSTNSLVVIGSARAVERVNAIVRQIQDQIPAAAGAIHYVTLPPGTNSAHLANLINGITQRLTPPGGRAGDLIRRSAVFPDTVGNALIIAANDSDFTIIADIIAAIAKPGDESLADLQTTVIPLKTAQAAALAPILMQMFSTSATPQQQSMREQIRRLTVANRGPQEADAEPINLDLTKAIRIIADPGMNALIVSSTAENVVAIERVVAMFDQLPITATATVQLFPLQNIAADQFARIVRELFAQGKQIGRNPVQRVQGVPAGAIGAALSSEIAISVDDRTNTVVVAGSDEAVALVDILCKRMDSDVIAGWVEPRIIPLRFADANELANTLNAVIVQGASNLPQSTPMQRQVGRLRMARVTANGGNVLESDVFSPMTRLVIRGEPKMNALILVGTPANIEIVTELVTMLDIESASPTASVRVYPIENASAARLGQTVKQLFDQESQRGNLRGEDRVVLQADERTNSLIVSTSLRSFAVLESLLKTLDSKLAPELREIRTLEVKSASATRLAGLVQQMMDARMERLRRVQPETADLEKATIVADARTNTLVVAAGNDTFEVIRKLAADLDVNMLGDAASVHVLPVAAAAGNLDRLANAINQIMERRYADLPAEVRRSQRPLVLTDSRTNSLLVTANPEDLASIEELMTKLSQSPMNPAVGIHLVTLPTTTRVDLIAPRIQRLMADRQASLGPTGTPTDRVTIEPDPSTNSLIIAASEENLEIIKRFVEVLLQAEAAVAEAGGSQEMEIVTLSATNRAADIVDMLRDLYVNEANRTRGANTVRVTSDDRLNAVLINAPANDVRSIKNLISQLEGAKPANVIEIKYVPLKSANAVETVSLIENVLSGRGIGPGRRTPRHATVLKYLREISGHNVPEPVEITEATPEAEMEVSAAIRESITLTPDLRTNTIIVSAPRESIGMIERMIRDLDESSTGSKNIRIFKLQNADAIAMGELLTELFKLKQGNSMYVLKPREEGVLPIAIGDAGATAAAGPAAPIGAFGGTELTAVPDERQQLSITVDSRTNSLIVSGTPTYLDLVSQVVQELDTLEANEREVFVYQLRNSVAADVAKVIGDFVEQEQRKLVSTLSTDQLGSAARLLEREITIQGDRQSNTVLVSASPRYMERVKDMIRQLDVDPPQVLIQVMLAEVTLDYKDEWGVDLSAMAQIGGTTITGGYGLASTFVPGLGVPNLAIASSDLDLLIRAMKSQGRLHVLSNPSIMAANNAPARIQVGETIRLPASTSVSDAGRTFSTLEKEDLGVILQVTPSINPDGFVRMTINPEISNLSARTTQISEQFQSPIITRRTADTTVTVHDGQTIVIGGLISDRFERRDRKVPFFGDVPVIGPLFRSNVEETAKTELLIVLTPHVIDSPAEFSRVDHITESEINRLSLPENVKESIRRSLIDGSGGLYNAKGERIDVEMNGEEKDK